MPLFSLRRFVSLVVLVGFGWTAQAQTAPAAPAPVAAGPVSVASQDSAVAVQRLFKSRRTGSTLIGFPGGFFIGAGLANLSSGGAITMLLGAPMAVVSITKGARFSKKKETQILADYQQGKPLPSFVRRRLKRKHFKA